MLVASFCCPVASSAQSILLSAGDFAVLGGTAVTSTGETVINGNVGSSAAVSGFPPGVITVDGSPANPIVGGTTGQAELDLIKAANGLAGMAATANIPTGELGGLTLPPGVYTFGSASIALDGALVLNANGQNNAVWVFQISASMTASSGSTVSLIDPGSNGGSDDGIFWVAETGAFTLGSGSTMLGNYLAYTSISFDGGDDGDGRALAQAGVTFASASTVDSQGGPDGSDYTGGLMYGPTGNVVPVPEPAAFLWLAPLGAMGFALWRRRSAMNKIIA